MLPLVRVGAAVSADVVTSTKLFVIRYNITVIMVSCISQSLW